MVSVVEFLGRRSSMSHAEDDDVVLSDLRDYLELLAECGNTGRTPTGSEVARSVFTEFKAKGSADFRKSQPADSAYSVPMTTEILPLLERAARVFHIVSAINSSGPAGLTGAPAAAGGERAIGVGGARALQLVCL